MSYLDDIHPASFRGIPFGVFVTSVESGRRTAIHLYPGRDKPYVEDFGRDVRRFRVDGLVHGDDYVAQRRRLFGAAEQSRAAAPDRDEYRGAVLVLPFDGARRVYCERVVVRDEFRRLRMSRFSFDFIEIGERLYPTASKYGAAAADSARDALDAAAGADLEANLKVSGVPESVREATREGLGVIGGALRRAQHLFTGPGDDVRALSTRIVQLVDDASQLSTSPAQLVETVQLSIHGVLDAVVRARDALVVYEDLLGLEAEQNQLAVSGQTTKDADANRKLVVDCGKQAAAAGLVRAAVRLEFESIDQARTIRSSVSGALDAVEATASDAVFQALQDLRATLAATVPPPEEDLPRVATIRPPSVLPAALIAYELYDDAGRGDEIVARNGISHPLLVPPEDLEVLVDAGS